jgi:pyridoxamine 5'-phosphate oxidase
VNFMQDISSIRTDYKQRSFIETDAAADPFTQFSIWWQEAIDSQIEEVNAMTLATVTPQGTPDARIVLLKGFDEKGFVFYTNYTSQKGREMAANPHVALVFFWKELERQVRVEGTIELVSSQQSEEYYHSRPVLSQLGAWASRQSEIIPDRQVLEENMEKYKQEFGEAIPRPPHWGGYLVKPTAIEFWQGRRSRLHDRLKYLRNENGWQLVRLAP